MNKKEPCEVCGKMCYDWKKKAMGFKSSWCDECQQKMGKQMVDAITKN